MNTKTRWYSAEAEETAGFCFFNIYFSDTVSA